MHDPKFEQEVQRRMHDLEFVPSESVWAGVRQGIAPRRRRRAAAVIWWLFPGMLLLAGGILMYRHSASTRGVAAVVPAVGTEKPAVGTGKLAGAAGNGNGGGAAGRVAENENGSDVEERGNVGGNGDVGGDGTIGESRFVGRNKTGNGFQESVIGAAAAEAAAAAEGTGMANVKERYRPGLIGGMESRRGVDGPALERQPVKTAVTGIARPRHPWRAGFAAGGGAASIYSHAGAGLATSPSPTNYSPGYASYGINAPNYGVPQPFATAYNMTAAASKQNETYIKAAYSYWAGIYGEKQLSVRWMVDIGLNLHYYSVRFETTNQVLFYAPSSSSLFAATSLTYTNSNNNYSGGELQTYDNRYYFLEVPVTVQRRLNRNRMLPLFWRGGAVVSYLMSSNALYYNAADGDVEKDNGVIRHTQASLQSGLMLGLPVRGVQVQAGPEVQYALTNMLTTGSGGGHMVYGGMRVTLMR
ncbi:MAG TPA: hypothetical protein VL978_00575 [Puia sp.]|nr:hypothetical protein [Puia sp.]